MTWQPTLSWKAAQQRATLLKDIRLFFDNRAVIEVETPLLSQGTVTDVHIEAMSCKYNFLSDSDAETGSEYFLQTSPEYSMKRLLASGYKSIYQISKAFRHEESGRFHNAEFTMLEWYRIGFNHFDLMEEVELLLINILQCEQTSRISYQNLFLQYVDIDPLTASKPVLLSIIDKHDKLSEWIIEEDDIDILLQFVFSEIIEPNIGISAPCFVYNFPLAQASLAKISRDDPRVAERFECYFRGIELANGFHELTDAREQIERFHEDNRIREAKGLKTKPVDKKFIAALKSGLPNCSGVALGIDRLMMLKNDADHIEQVVTFCMDNA